MKIRSIRTKLIVVVIAMVAAAVIWMTSPARHVLAVQDPEYTPSPFGLAPGQTARLSILNSGEARGYIIVWKFLDSTGRVLAQAAERTFIPTDQFRSIDVDGDALDA